MLLNSQFLQMTSQFRVAILLLQLELLIILRSLGTLSKPSKSLASKAQVDFFGAANSFALTGLTPAIWG